MTDASRPEESRRTEAFERTSLGKEGNWMKETLDKHKGRYGS